MSAGKFQPGEILHLVKKIVEHHTPGSGVIRTTELTTLTHVSVVVLGKTVGRNPTIDEQVQMEARAKRAMAADAMLEALTEAMGAIADHSANCKDLHHDKADRHELHMDCPVEARLHKLEARIRAVIAKATGGES